MSKVLEVVNWLNKHFIEFEYVNNVFLIGSVLEKGFKEANDIDIVVALIENRSGLKVVSEDFRKVKQKFGLKFNKSLHITCFTQNEEEALNSFMSKNNFKKIC